MWLYIGYCDRVSLPGLKLFFWRGNFGFVLTGQHAKTGSLSYFLCLL